MISFGDRVNLPRSIKRYSLRAARLGTAALAEDDGAVPALRRVGVGHTTEPDGRCNTGPAWRLPQSTYLAYARSGSEMQLTYLVQRMTPVARERSHLGWPASRFDSFSPFATR
jgi:hypothetical protein